MFSFRQKILISHLAVFFVFIALMFPFASELVKQIIEGVMEDRAAEVIAKVQGAPDDAALVERLKETKSLVFFRVSIVNNDKQLLYDSHTKRILGQSFSPDHVVDYPEVLEAFKNGIGYHEGYSAILDQRFFYLAKAFDFQGKTYVLRTALPYQYVEDLSRQFEMGFLGLSTIALLLFSLMTWFIIYHLTSPIQQIITAVKPYQEGVVAAIPAISLKTHNQADDIGKLADTLNSMSTKIQRHINTLTYERNEKKIILDSLVEGVVATDTDMAVTFANNMALVLLNMSSEELIGNTFSAAHHSKCRQLLADCQQERKVLTDTLVVKNGDDTVYLDVAASPKKDGTGAILVLQDKSFQYKLLEMRNKMLEMRKDFIANASHELKTPVTIIRGFAETLHDNPDLPEETVLVITDKIVKNCKRMTTLIKDLLTLSDIENIPESRLIECDLYELIENCCSILRDAFPSIEISLQKINNVDMLITADRNLMEMAMINLIENAAKYSNPPAQITITLEHLEHSVTVIINDRGIGIPAHDLEHIFERFYSANKAHSQKLGGSGLGLSIVENIISKHFGKISVTSIVGVGTSFTIVLPIVLGKETNVDK